MIKGKTIFITGGVGFIGSTIAGRLLEQNRIVAYDNLSRNSMQHKTFKDHPNLTLIPGDILDYQHLRQAMGSADIVVHCAAIAGIDTVVKSPVNTMRVNMMGSANVLEAAAQLPRAKEWSASPRAKYLGSRPFAHRRLITR